MVNELAASAATVTLNWISAVPPTGNEALLSHSMTPLAWLQMNPPVVEKPLRKDMPAGNASTIRIAPTVGAEPMFSSVNV